MKILALLSFVSLSAFAQLNNNNECLQYLNGELSSKIYDLSELNLKNGDIPQTKAFSYLKFREEEKTIGDKRVKILVPDIDADEVRQRRADDPNFRLNARTRNEEPRRDGTFYREVVVESINGKGKPKAEYVVKLEYDKDGNLTYAQKKNAARNVVRSVFSKLDVSEELHFSHEGGYCRPTKGYHNGGKLFDTVLCKNLINYVKNSPKAQACIEEGVADKIIEIVRASEESGLDYPYSIGKKDSKLQSAARLGAIIEDCNNQNVSQFADNSEIWKVDVTNPEVPNQDSGKKKKQKKQKVKQQ